MLIRYARRASVHDPAEAREVFDVTGAGDTVIAVLAAAVTDLDAKREDLDRRLAEAKRYVVEQEGADRQRTGVGAGPVV